MLKNIFSSGLEKLLLAGVVSLGSIGLTNNMKAQDINSAQFFLGSTMSLGVFDTGNIRKDRFVRNLGHWNAHLGLYGMYNHIYAHPSRGIAIYPYEDTPGHNKGLSFFLYNTWEDKDGNGRLGNVLQKEQFLDELVGVHKEKFYDNEKGMYFRINAKHMKGHTINFSLIDSRNEIVYSENSRVNSPRWNKVFDFVKMGLREKVINNHGHGKYFAGVYIDGELFGGREFDWIPSSQFYIGEWNDSNRNGKLDSVREIVEIGKREFGPNDHIIVNFDTYNHAGQHGEIKMFDSNNRKVHSFSQQIPTNGYQVSLDAVSSRVINQHGYGSYKFISYVNDDPRNRIDIEISDGTRGKLIIPGTNKFSIPEQLPMPSVEKLSLPPPESIN